MKALMATLAILFTSASMASTTDCQNLYVGRIMVLGGSGGLYSVVFLNSAQDGSGSYWVNFSGWSVDDKKAALSLLTAAKLASHRVNVETTATGGCGIQLGGTVATSVTLANSP